jgi:cytochrome c5
VEIFCFPNRRLWLATTIRENAMKSADVLCRPVQGESCPLPRALHLGIALLLLFSFGCQQLASQKAAPTPLSGAELFKSKCGKCHDLERALGKSLSKEAWYATIIRMKKEHQADITQSEIEQLVQYHVARQVSEAALFKEKCEKCHPGKVFLEKTLSADQARAIIKRMQQKAGNTISDQDVEIIIRYHVRSQKDELARNLRAISSRIADSRPSLEKDSVLFRKKCTACHEASRALSVIKDPEAWEQTIRRMQSYSKGAITDLDVKDLVDFHVSVQRREIDTFRQTCTKCHDDARINSRSMSEEQWLATIKRMQQKAPELITDEKVDILAAYFHRRELTLARIFYGKCRLCHPDILGATQTLTDTTKQMDGLVSMANDQFGRSLQLTDINSLLSIHLQRQKRELRFYESGCTKCHPGGLPNRQKAGPKSTDERSRAEWISFIAILQGTELSKDLQETIDSQLDYHIARHRG